MAITQQGDPMLEKFFSAPKSLRRLRGGISGPHIDAFADDLERDGYAPASAVRYIRAAAHLGCFVQRRRPRPSDTRGGELAASEVAALLVTGRGRPADRSV